MPSIKGLPFRQRQSLDAYRASKGAGALTYACIEVSAPANLSGGYAAQPYCLAIRLELARNSPQLYQYIRQLSSSASAQHSSMAA